MAEEQINFDIYQPFGPSILKTKLPQVYVDALNKQSDDVLMMRRKVKREIGATILPETLKKRLV